MSINYNDRTGVLGINLTPQFNNSFQTAGLFGFGKSDEEKALEQIQDLRKQENQIKGLGEGAIELKQNELQNIQNQIENLKKQYPNDSSIQSASLPSNRYTADLRNLNDRITDIPDRLSRSLDYDLINKVREYNPNYDRYTDQEITELGIPIFNKNMPSSMNSGVTNANSFRNMLLDDLRNLPSDLRTSLGQTKDALVEDVSGLGSFLKDKSMNLFNSGKDLGKTAISGLISLATGIPGAGLILDAFQMSPEEKTARDFYEKKYGLTNTGQVASGIMQGYNPVSMFGGPGLLNSIDKRLATILRTEENKKKKDLELSQELINRRKKLEALRAQEAANASAFLESQRRGDRPTAPTGGGVKDTAAREGKSPGQAGVTGGYSYSGGKREGFGYGL